MTPEDETFLTKLHQNLNGSRTYPGGPSSSVRWAPRFFTASLTQLRIGDLRT